jgi:SWI/SNF-related matrix-associated actin-dependent regulator 1 of chromatin subfamily A
MKKHAVWDKKAKLLRIYFPYHPTTVALVRTLHDRKFIREPEPHWTAPPKRSTIRELAAWGFEMEPALHEKIKKKQEKPAIELVKEIPGLKLELYPFQLEGVSFIEGKKGRALVGDEMGLGKTAQALAWLQLHPDKRPAVVVCPASLKGLWRSEIKKWTGSQDIHIVSGRYNNKKLPKADIYIINYDIIAEMLPDDGRKIKYKFRTDIMERAPQVVVVDECHHMKNAKAQRTKALKYLTGRIPHRIALSGTPIVNKPIEYFNALNFVAPKRFGSFWQFAQRYCGAKSNGFGWDFTGATNTYELHELLTRTIMIRRTKAEVLPELPPKTRTIVPLPLSNKKDYFGSVKELCYSFENEEWKVKGNAVNMLAEIERLKQLAVVGKIDSAVAWVEEYLEEQDKLVVFTTHQKTVDVLAGALKEHKPLIVDGRTSVSKRNGIVERFQTRNEHRVFIGNLKAAGTGLTLTAASATCFVELGWTPGEHDQAEDRVHRIGQGADSVMAYYLVAEGTIEEDIASLIDEKRKVLKQVLDGQEVQETELLTELLKRLKEYNR